MVSGGPFNCLTLLFSVWLEVHYVPDMKNKTNTTFISQSATVQSLQPSLKPLHIVTCGELWRGNKTNHPVHSLSSMWGRCIDLRALLYKKREEHITQYRLVLFWSSSLWKRIACLKGLVSMPLVTSIMHRHTENKTTWFSPCIQSLSSMFTVMSTEMMCMVMVIWQHLVS